MSIVPVSVACPARLTAGRSQCGGGELSSHSYQVVLPILPRMHPCEDRSGHNSSPALKPGRLTAGYCLPSNKVESGRPNLMVGRTTFELAVTIQDRDGQRNSEGCGRHGSRACRAAGSRDCLPHSRLLAILRAPTTLAATCPCFGRDEGQRHRCRWPHCAVKTGDRREIVTMNVVVSEDGDSSGPSTGRDAFQ